MGLFVLPLPPVLCTNTYTTIFYPQSPQQQYLSSVAVTTYFQLNWTHFCFWRYPHSESELQRHVETWFLSWFCIFSKFKTGTCKTNEYSGSPPVRTIYSYRKNELARRASQNMDRNWSAVVQLSEGQELKVKRKGTSTGKNVKKTSRKEGKKTK